jgi:hypothetical protein
LRVVVSREYVTSVWDLLGDAGSAAKIDLCGRHASIDITIIDDPSLVEVYSNRKTKSNITSDCKVIQAGVIGIDLCKVYLCGSIYSQGNPENRRNLDLFTRNGIGCGISNGTVYHQGGSVNHYIVWGMIVSYVNIFYLPLFVTV